MKLFVNVSRIFMSLSKQYGQLVKTDFNHTPKFMIMKYSCKYSHNYNVGVDRYHNFEGKLFLKV